MPESYTGGLNFDWPVKAETNWDTVVQDALAAISSHTHGGGGTGTPISVAGIADDSITGAKVRLNNVQSLRGRNVAGSNTVNIARVDASDIVELPSVTRLSSSETIVAAGAISVATTITIINITVGGACTLATGAEGQIKYIVNIAAGTSTVTPSVTTGVNTATLVTHGAVQYIYLSGQWRGFAGAGCTLA